MLLKLIPLCILVVLFLITKAPWSPTSVTIFKGEEYILEWHDVAVARLEVGSA